GCFSGDTKIALVDGRNISFKELIEEQKLKKEHFCYTILNNGHVGIQRVINARKTKTNVEVVKIILDNDEEIVCTPDHLFMKRNGDFKKAIELKETDSLMPLYLEAIVTVNNHKIKSIIQIEERIDVYDIEVPETHNFALASGVFVHNSAKQGRNRAFQAILPLRGKILNVEKARLIKVLENAEIGTMITAIGTSLGEEFDIAKLRYNKVIIMTDADVDGNHIACLLLTFFYRHMKPLIDAGKVFLAQPPLYKLEKNRKIKYAYNDDEKNKLLEEWGKDGVGIQRYKGLGEMNPTQLWETTMEPKNRVLKQITVDDAILADQVFSILMGPDVEPRKEFIQMHAKEVTVLDV
ncbi:DNA topoisomerase IV subunit B, partial [Candidatus Woesearchaeota archaeon]|nr:DNA topoisomerase IV subunit B [Candidatus Woesearchaeota archaeon]